MVNLGNWNATFLFFEILPLLNADAQTAGASAADVSAGDKIFHETFQETKKCF